MVTALVSGSRGTVALHLASQPRGTLEKLIAKGRVAYILRLNGDTTASSQRPQRACSSTTGARVPWLVPGSSGVGRA